MKLFDKILSVSLIVYIIWICYYRLFGDINNDVHSQIYFILEPFILFITLFRLFIEKWFPIFLFEARYIVFVVMIFKLFQVIYRTAKFSFISEKYYESLSNIYWSFLGVVLVFGLFAYPIVKKYYKKWAKK